MKIRNGFVSNSSSSSFVLPKKYLSEVGLEKLYNHIEEAEKHSVYYDFGCMDAWSISENEDYIMGYTHMDNFDMHEFLVKYLNVPSEIIKWED
jgi:hypothetical protein